MTDTPSPGACPPQQPFDPRDFRNALGTFPTGVTVVTTTGTDGTLIGLTCNSFSSVSLAPALVLWSLSLRSPNLSNFLQAPHFAINILAAEQRDISHRFAQSIANKFEGVRHTQGALGVPLIADAAAHLECRNETRYYSGDHVIFIGHVLHYAYRQCAPLVFCSGKYAKLEGDEGEI
ncbi:MAG TPA: flavin reductase family protein [Burkholderiales bacterium]|nr:flavin reductase family protein [Burkholderiales bacterium]